MVVASAIVVILHSRTTDILRNVKKSCGCLIAEKLKEIATTHSLSRSRIYRTYSNMIRRCTNPIEIEYENYGGRGIKVCDEWTNDFMNFYNWAIANGYTDKLTIDRIDNDGNYCPENCKWSTYKEQCRNKSNNRIICINGIEKTLVEWSELSGIDRTTIYRRIKASWDEKRFIKTCFPQ